MSFFYFSKKNTQKFSLLFDIRGDSVVSAIVKTSSTDKPEIIYSNNIPVVMREEVDPERYTGFILKGLGACVDDAYKNGVVKTLKTLDKSAKIEDIHIILSSPWVLSQSKDITIKKDKDFRIDQNLLKKVLLDEESDISSSDIFSQKESGKKNGTEVIEEKIIQSKINGYKIDSIFQKSANELNLNLLISASNTSFIKSVKTAIGKMFGQNKISFHSFLLCGFSVIRDIYPHKNDFIFVDISAETTDVCVVTDDVIHKIYSYTLGKNDIIRKISEKTGNPYDMVVSLLNLQCNGNCDEKLVGRNETALTEVILEWTVELYKIFDTVISRNNIPKDIFFSVDDDIINIIGKKMQVYKTAHSILNNDFIINLINDGAFNNYINKGKTIVRDARLKECALFLNKLK